MYFALFEVKRKEQYTVRKLWKSKADGDIPSLWMETMPIKFATLTK